MSRLIDLDDIKSKIDEKLDSYKEKIASKEPEVMKEILDVLVLEREIIMNELEYRKNNGYRQYKTGLDLIVTGFQDESFNYLGMIASRLKVSKKEILNVLMKIVVDKEGDDFPQVSASDLIELIANQGPNYSINMVNNLSVNKNELDELDGRVNFNMVEGLTFEKDVDADTFLRVVSSINHCTGINFESDEITPLIVFSKANFCQEFLFRAV